MSISRKITEGSGGGSGETYVDDVFSTYLYKGNGTTQDIVNGIDLAGEGGMIWTKERSPTARHHSIGDSERDSFRNYLSSERDIPATGVSAPGSDITSVSSTGYSLGAPGFTWNNEAGSDQVSWTFRKAPKFFDVVTYTGNGVAGREIPHNLGVEPGMIFVKRTDGVRHWPVYHKSIGNGHALELDEVKAKEVSTYWNNASPTDTVFTIGPNPTINGNDSEFVAYVFAHDDSEGMIQCGSYTGSNGAGQEIDLGWEPQYVLIKNASRDPAGYATDWVIRDNMRGVSDTGYNWLYANTNGEEVAGDGAESGFVFTPTGFKTTKSFSHTDFESDQFIYMAIRRPNKPAEEFEPEELFATVKTRSGIRPCAVAGFPVDMAWIKNPTRSDEGNYLASRLTQGDYLETHSSEASFPAAIYTFDYQDGWFNFNSDNYYSWMWRRAPGFFDVVTYEGTGVTGHTVSHGLQVVPELILYKSRDLAESWPVYYGDANAYMYLNDARAKTPSGTFWESTAPTETVFSVSKDHRANNYPSSQYIAYLFASVPGISKVGSYTGTAATLDIDCGFTTGARFVLIKHTDVSGNWYFWDTERGISSGNDPFLQLNTTTAQTSFNVLTPLASGFTVNADSSNYPLINTNGGTYIYMAIA